MLPLLLLVVSLAAYHVYALQSQNDREAEGRIKNIVTAIDYRLEAQIAALQVLAASPLSDHQAGMPGLYREALEFRERFGGHVVLADLSMQMLFNTRVPFGTTLPKLPKPRGFAAVPAALSTGKPAVGDTFPGPIAQERLVAVAVPVARNGQTKALLLSVIEARQFQQQLDTMILPDGWTVTILDGRQEVIAHRGPDAGMGTGIAPGRFSATSTVSHWSVALTIPRTAYYAPVIAASAAFASAILIFTLVSVLGGRFAGQRLARSVALLSEPSIQQAETPEIVEIDEVRRRLDETAVAIRESEAKFKRLSREFQGLLDAIPDSLMLLDRNLTVLWANIVTSEKTGVRVNEVEGARCSQLWQHSTRPCDSCPVLKTFATGLLQSETVTMPDGRVWDIRTVPLLDDAGNTERVISVKRDITEHRKLEAQYLQAQKMESIGVLAGGVAHDFNNILSAIIGYGHIALMRMAKNDPQRQTIEDILESADRAARLTKDLLLFSRKEAVARRPVELNRVIMRIEGFLKRVIGEDIICTATVGNSPLMVFADTNQLEQVLMNLATNARDAMSAGGIFSITTDRVRLSEDFISVHGYGSPGDYALVTVSDSGGGMDESTRKHIFEPFFTTKEVGKGTGLGLAVVYGIVKQHEGFVHVYSETGKGTTFRIYLPLITSDAVEENRNHAAETPVGGTETLLVAEDDATLRKLTTKILRQYGYTVVEASDGEDAVRIFQENRDTVSLLLFDLIMPKMNGKEAFDEILKIRPDMKIIFASGYAPDIIREKLSFLDGQKLIYKPFSPLELLRVVRSVLDNA